jgi:glycerol-3-phosphate dehydrogenase subunit B
VTFLLGHSVSKVAVSAKRCERVEVAHPPISNSFSADRYILATGRFIGGGLTAGTGKIVEPLFDLPVSQPGSREEWFQRTFFHEPDHPIHRAGILTDASLKPLDREGKTALENVWIAGSILAHHDSIAEKSREGIEIATGYMAARQALDL